jgi:membrane fusion protein (multidrug efflux system)
MRSHWPINSIVALTIFCTAVALPQVGWPKDDRPVQLMRSVNGALRGIVKASTQAVLYSQIQGRISQIPVKEGQRFEKGATLVAIDCDKYRAELAGALAEHEAKDKTFRNNKELTKLNAVSTLELEISEAEAKKAARGHSPGRDQRAQLPYRGAVFRPCRGGHGQ